MLQSLEPHSLALDISSWTLLVQELEGTAAQVWSEILAALVATQGQISGFVSQLPYRCHLKEVASVGD